MLSILVFATGLERMSRSSGAAFMLPEATPARVYVSNGASLGPPPVCVPATAGFGFGAVAAGATAGLLATLGFGFGLAPGGVSDGLAATAGLGFGDPPAGVLVCLSVLAGSVGCVMITSLKNGLWSKNQGASMPDVEKKHRKRVSHKEIRKNACGVNL
jgi:hypothetical protein